MEPGRVVDHGTEVEAVELKRAAEPEIKVEPEREL